MPPAVAILIDVENMHRYLKDEQSFLDLLERIGEYGDVRYRRAYANWNNTQASALYSRMGCELIQTYHPVSGKNTADIQIAVDAMDLLALHADIGCFVLATGDSDFSPLFRRLRERGKAVVGCGPRSLLSETVKYHCTYFILANTLRNSEPPRPAETPEFHPQEARKLLVRALRAQVGAVNASLVGETMRKLDPSFDHRLLGFGNFRSFLEQYQDILELHPHEKGAIYVTARKVPLSEIPADKHNERPSDPPSDGPTLPTTDADAVRDLLRRALATLNGAEANISLLGERMRELDPGFSYKALGFEKLSQFLTGYSDLIETRTDPKGPTFVRAR